MRVLFVHQNFPGQFRHVATALMREPGNEIGVVTDTVNKQQIQRLPVVRYRFEPKGLPGLSGASASLLHRFQRGEAAAAGMLEFKRRGFVPDVIVGHPGWGELMLAREVFPSSPLITHAEFYYSAEGADVGFDPEFAGVTDELRLRLKAKNMPLLTALADCERAVAPTAWQASRCPERFANRITVLHEGINTAVVRPNSTAVCTLGKHTFRSGDEVVTFVNRNLEPMRGYHIFMRALPAILAARPNAHVVIVGGTGVSYGPPPPAGKTWKDIFLSEVADRLPAERVHFVGQTPYSSFVALMQVSSLHIYATYPFVLSWSMLEAMSAGALVLASATPPVTEMIEHGRNGLLFDFFDVKGLAAAAIEALAEPARFSSIREAARRFIVDHYDLESVCQPAWVELVKTVARRP